MANHEHTGYPVLQIKGQKNYPKIQKPLHISGHQNYDVKHVPITKDQKNIRHQCKKFSPLLQMQFKLGMPTCTD